MLLSLIFPFSGSAQETPIEAPGSIEEAKGVVQEGSKKIVEKMPDIIKTIWREQVIPLWSRMWNWFKGIWKSYLQPFFSDLWYSTLKPRIKSLIEKVRGLIWKKVEEQKPIIKEEIGKEAEEMKEEIPKTGKSLWERFKELLR